MVMLWVLNLLRWRGDGVRRRNYEWRLWGIESDYKSWLFVADAVVTKDVAAVAIPFAYV